MPRRSPIILLCLLAARAAVAAPPSIDTLAPLGGQRGTTVTLKMQGKFAPWPVEAWADSPQIHVKAEKDVGTLSVQIDKECPVGPHLIRLYNADGAAPPELFVVSDTRETAEAEPNDDYRKPQRATTMPVIVNGHLEKSGDVDCYAVHLDAGQRLVAAVQGRRLGSPIDPMLHVISDDGIEQAFVHDGLGLDPLLVFVAPRSADYVVRVSAFVNPPQSDLRLSGGKDDFYRLHLTTGPAARFTFPAAVERGKSTTVQLIGENLPDNATVTVDATRALPDDRSIIIAPPGVDGFLHVGLSDHPERLASDLLKTPAPVQFPIGITGRLASDAEEHAFTFAAKKGDALRFVVHAPSIHSSLDAIIRVEDATGKTLATANSAANPAGLSDASLNWAAPADGAYRVVIADLYRKSGSDYVYHLTVAAPTPRVSAALAADALTLPAGGSAALKLTVARPDGHAAPLIATATQLPAGIIATSADVPAKGGEVKLTLTAGPDAKPGSAPIRLVLLGTDPAHPEAHTATYGLRPASAGRKDKATPQELIDGTDALWLTILPPPATAPTTAPTTKPTK